MIKQHNLMKGKISQAGSFRGVLLELGRVKGVTRFLQGYLTTIDYQGT